jgi:hypothetical protein
MPVGKEPPLLNKYFNEEPYTQTVNTPNFVPKKTKKILITQYFKVNTSNKVYNKERQKEIDACLELNIRNTQIDELHLLTEEQNDLAFLSNTHMNKITQIVIGKRLDYQTAFDYYNENLAGHTCILSNADIFTDESLELLDYINLENTVLALTRYEYNDGDKPSLLYGSEEKSRAPFLYDDYEPIVGSQDTWIWNTLKIDMINCNFQLGVHGCDNRIATLLIDSGYNIYNPSYLISTSHYDRIGTKIINGDIRKGLVSLERDPPPADSYLYKTFLSNTTEIVDKYTTAVTYKNTITTSKPYWQPKYFIEMVVEKQIVELPYSEVPSTLVYKEFEFNSLCNICVIDLICNTGNVSKFGISYLKSDSWVDYDNTFNGSNKEYGNFIKRNYLDPPFACKKLRIHVLEYKGNPEMNFKYYGEDLTAKYRKIYENTAFITLTNSGYIDYTLNCLESLKKINFKKELSVYCIGDNGMAILEDKGYISKPIESDGVNTEFQIYRTGKWSNVVFNKFKIIYENLLSNKYVCYTDGDIVFENSDFLDYMIENINDNDILIQDNSHKEGERFCSGFMFVKSTQTTIELFDPANVEEFKETVGWGDQKYINEIMNKLKHKMLPLELYPSGKFYYDNFEKISPYIIHFNWLRGHEKKDKLKSHNKWYLEY